MMEDSLTTVKSASIRYEEMKETAIQHHSTMSEPQCALLRTIYAGRDVVDKAQSDLSVRFQLPELGTDPASMQWKQNTMDVKKQCVSFQLAAMNAATAQMIKLTSGHPEEANNPDVAAAVTNITTNLSEMSKDVKVIAALMNDDLQGENLMDATRNLCAALSDMLTAAEPETKENLLNASGRVGEASHTVLKNIREEDIFDNETQGILLNLANGVANDTYKLVLKAKNIDSKSDDQTQHEEVISAADKCTQAISQLVACAKAVAPTITNLNCQKKLIEAARDVSRAVECVKKSCHEATQDDGLLKDMKEASCKVENQLTYLQNHIRTASKARAQATVHDATVDIILNATDRMFSSTGDAEEMVRQAKILASATATLGQDIKEEADFHTDLDNQETLFATAKVLADVTAKIMESAKDCASNPHNSASQEVLEKATWDIRRASNAALNNALNKKLIWRLEYAAKYTAAMSIQNIVAAQGASHYIQNSRYQEDLLESCKELSKVLSCLVQSVKGTMMNVDNPSSQLNLMGHCQMMIQLGNKMVSSSRTAMPTITDPYAALLLHNSTKQMTNALNKLRYPLMKVKETCARPEIESTLDFIRSLDDELLAFRKAAERLELKSLPGETMENSALLLGFISNEVESMVQFLTDASQINELDIKIAVQYTGGALNVLTKSVRGVAATSPDRDVQTKIIDHGRDVMGKVILLIREFQRQMNNLSNSDFQQRLTQIAKTVSTALTNCVNCLPGQTDMDDAIRNITQASKVLNDNQFPHSNIPYKELQSNLSSAADNLNFAAADVVTSYEDSPANLVISSKKFETAFNELLNIGIEIIGGTWDTDVCTSMVVNLKNVFMVSSKLLVASKSVAVYPGAPNAKQQLACAARSVTESINNLNNVCTSAAPGQNECDNAIRNIQIMRILLENPIKPINDLSYQDCLDLIIDKSKILGEAMTGIANHAKKNDHDNFRKSVNDVSGAVCGLVEAAAQAAYLVGASDPSSAVGKSGLVDVAQFARSKQAIQSANQQITNSESKQQQIAALEDIRKHMSAVCISCSIATSDGSNPASKRHFYQSAKVASNAVINLRNQIKVFIEEPSERNHQNRSAAIKQILEAVENFATFATFPEFASIPAKISQKARVAQEPITFAGKSIIYDSCNVISSAKRLAKNPEDPLSCKTLTNHSKNISDSIKNLVDYIKDMAPGQKECDAAIEKLSACIRELNNASLSAISQNLTPRVDYNLKDYQEQMENSASEILDRIDFARNAAKGDTEKLGHMVTQMILFFVPLVQNAIGTASKTDNATQQMVLLHQTKTVAKCALQLIYALKEAGINSKATHVHCDLDDSADVMKDALQVLLHILEAAAMESGSVTGLVDLINKSIANVDKHPISNMSEGSFVDYQTQMVTSAEEVARLGQEMTMKSNGESPQLIPLAAKLAHQFSNIACNTCGAIETTFNLDLVTRIQDSVQELGTACVDLITAAGSCQGNPNCIYSQHDVSDNACIVAEKVSFVLSALQARSRGTQACIITASTVSDIVGDLDNIIVLATAGTLHAKNENEIFSDHRKIILKAANALIVDAASVFHGAASSQEQLATAARNVLPAIQQLADVVKNAAVSLGSNNREAQVLLINSVKDVALALGHLVLATKAAFRKSIDDPVRINLNDSVQVMDTALKSLMKTFEDIEKENNQKENAEIIGMGRDSEVKREKLYGIWKQIGRWITRL